MALKTLKEWPEPGDNALSFAYSALDDTYEGPVLMEVEGGSELAVFPTRNEAHIAAGFAINLPLCGYFSVVLRPAENLAVVTHSTAEEWLFS